MQDELQALESNNTWTLIQLPKGKKTVGSKWVYELDIKLMAMWTDLKQD